MNCGCQERKHIMFEQGKPGKAEVFILFVAVGALTVSALPKIGASARTQGVIYGMVLGTALGEAARYAFNELTNDDPDPIN